MLEIEVQKHPLSWPVHLGNAGGAVLPLEAYTHPWERLKSLSRLWAVHLSVWVAGKVSVTYHCGQRPVFCVVCARSDEDIPLEREAADSRHLPTQCGQRCSVHLHGDQATVTCEFPRGAQHPPQRGSESKHPRDSYASVASWPGWPCQIPSSTCAKTTSWHPNLFPVLSGDETLWGCG